MIYQPRNVQPSGVSIDGLLDNTFTMEIQTNSYVSAYQLLIVDFDNNEIYTGSKTTLANYAYNGDILEIPVSASAVALSNGTNYKWRVRLYQPTADMLITYGLVQATSTTTTIYLQPNINIKAGMAITINSQTKTISSYNSDTGVAVVSNAFSSAPAVGTQYKIYSDFIETVPDYIVYARQTPAVAISNVPSSLTLKYHTFQGTYTQSDNVPIVYHQFDLYTRNDDGTISLVTSSDKVYSANLSYTYDSFRTGNEYLIQMTVENDMGIISTTDMYEFNVSYDIVEYLQQPLASFDDKNNAVKVSWVTPVENEATSFRSDAAIGIIQDNNNTLTQATFEPGQSIGEGDVVQITNSDCELVIDGKSTQATRSGKNKANIKNYSNTINGVTLTINNGEITLNGTATGDFVFTNVGEFLYKAGKSYSGTFIYSSGSCSDYGVGIYLANSPTSNINIGGGASFRTNQSRTFNITSKTEDLQEYFYVKGYKESVYTNYKVKVQIVEGTTADYDYEPYGVMPSPDYPSEIESVGTYNEETGKYEIELKVTNGTDTNTSLFVLDQPLRSLPNGVKDKLYIKNNKLYVDRYVGSVVLDGKQQILAISTADHWVQYRSSIIGKDAKQTNFLMSNYYLDISSGKENFVQVYYENYARFLIKDTRIGDTILTRQEWKNWLSTHNVEVYYALATPYTVDLGNSVVPYIDGINYMHILSNIDTTFSLVYPHKTISGNAYDYTEFNPPGAKQTGTIKSYNAITGVGTLMPQYPFMYTPMQGDSYAVISNIYNVSGFSYLYNTPYNTVNSLYTHGYTATWATPDGLCVLPDDFNITLQFSPDGNFFYDQNGVYQEVVNLITTETDDANNEGEFTIKIDKNKLIFVQNPDISLELPFYTNTTQVFVLSSASVAQINNDYVWDDTATWTDTYTWVEGGTSLERVCNHWWKVQITNTGIKIEEIFPTT